MASFKSMRTLAMLLLAALPLTAAGEWKDRAEYDLVLRIRAEASPQKRIALLDDWKKKFPQSNMRQVRRELYLTTYQFMNDTARMLAVADEMIAEQPGNFVGLYWTTVLTPALTSPKPERLKASEAAARQLLNGLDKFFAADRKAAGLSDADWKKERDAVELLGRRTLAWVQWQKADYAAAEKELTDYLRVNPKDTEIASWLGTVMVLQGQPEKISPALWRLAYASGVRGEGALAEVQRKQVDGLLEKAYSGYHGDDPAGLQKLVADAAASPEPPANFQVVSATAIAQQKEDEALALTDPDLLRWKIMRRRLEQPDGETYFEQGVKNVPTAKIKATLVKSSPSGRPTELVVWVSEMNAQEVTLKLNSPLPNDADIGWPITFEGIPESFVKSPFSITMTVDKDKIEGWPAKSAKKK
jgi:hypothetical protein